MLCLQNYIAQKPGVKLVVAAIYKCKCDGRKRSAEKAQSIQLHSAHIVTVVQLTNSTTTTIFRAAVSVGKDDLVTYKMNRVNQIHCVLHVLFEYACVIRGLAEHMERL